MTLRSARLVERTGRRVLLLQHLGVLVVDHRLRGVDLLAQQRRHVELLLDQGDPGLRVDARLLQAGEQLELVAEAPVADLLTGQARGRGQPRVLPRDLQRAGPLVDLADVGDLRALLARGQRLGHPRDGEVDRAGGQLGLRHDVDAALDDGHVEALLGPEARVLRRVVAGELALRDPLQLQLDLGGRGAGGVGGSGASAGRSAAVARASGAARGEEQSCGGGDGADARSGCPGGASHAVLQGMRCGQRRYAVSGRSREGRCSEGRGARGAARAHTGPCRAGRRR